MFNSNYDKDGFYVLRWKIDPKTGVKSSGILSPSNVICSPTRIGENDLVPSEPKVAEDYLGVDRHRLRGQYNWYSCNAGIRSWARNAWDTANDIPIPDPDKSTFRQVENEELNKVVRLILNYKGGVVLNNSRLAKPAMKYPVKGLKWVPIDSVKSLTQVINELATMVRNGFRAIYAKYDVSKIDYVINKVKLVIVYQDASYTSVSMTPRDMIDRFGLHEDPKTGRITVPMKQTAKEDNA